jgi:twitching motility protein PilT
MKERIAINTYRLRKLAIGMRQFTVNELVEASGASKQTVHDFIRNLRKQDSLFIKQEKLEPLGPGRPIERYLLTSEGLAHLVTENTPFAREINEGASVQTTAPVPVLIKAKSRVLAWKEQVDSWLATVLPQFELAVQQGASALLIQPEQPCSALVGRQMHSFPGVRVWTADEIMVALNNILTPWQQQRLEKRGWTASAYRSENYKPLDLHVRLASGKPVMELRFLPTHIPTLDELHLSPLVNEIAGLKFGLVLVTGLPGSGKTGAMAAMIGRINATESGRITTIEEPICYFHESQRSFVEQRQVAIDTPDFSPALEEALATHANVVALSDIADQETFATVMAAAERTLLLCRVSAPDPAEAIRKLINLFPGAQQDSARSRLASSLAGIIRVAALPEASGKGTVSATEVLRWQPEARETIINPEKTSLIAERLAQHEGSAELLEESVRQLYNRGKVSEEVANRYMVDLDVAASS